MGYKRYEKYKDSGVEWIGEIPEHWEVCKLKHILKKLVSGGTPTSTDEDNWTEDEDGINWVSISDMSNTDKIYKTVKKITLKGFREKNLKILKSGTLIYSIYATLGRVAELKIDAVTNQAILGLILEEHVNKQFIKRYLESLERYILYLSSSNTQNNLNAEKVKNIDLVMPEKKEQTAIAKFLDKKTAEIDSFIADKEKMILLLQEERQAIITEAVTKGLDPNVPLKNSGVEWIGEIPSHWEVSRIKYQAYINKNTLSENTDEDYEMIYIDISSVNSRGEITNSQEMTFNIAPSRARRIIRNGDTIVSTVRTYLKAIAYCENLPNNCICSTGFAVLTPKRTIHKKYLYYLMRSEIYINEIMRRSVGVSYPAINASDIGCLQCLLPPLDEQQLISNFLDQKTGEIDSLISDIQTQIDRLKEYRQSLIYEAVTGKIDVRDFVPDEEGVAADA